MRNGKHATIVACYTNTMGNAHLIAASPKMFDFIERWVEIIQGGDKLESLEGWAREFVEEAHEVMSKARGESPMALQRCHYCFGLVDPKTLERGACENCIRKGWAK